MVRIFKQTNTYSEDFPTIALAYFLRYPNPHASHIISCDVLSREITSDGTLHTRRLILKSGKVPVWARALVGGWGEGLGAWVVEDSWVQPHAPHTYLYSQTRNITHAKLLSVTETSEIFPSPTSDHVLHSTEGRIKTSLNAVEAVRRRVEMFGEGKFVRGLEKSRLGLSHIIERVKERRANLPAVLEARGIAGVGLGITS
ncbi:PRELI-like family-domain-containing protein [Mrakia frigida]|uniref:Ups1p n=1 Tax=Mrakia frigida TaxID=29902 RepID=UPI003FCC19A3